VADQDVALAEGASKRRQVRAGAAGEDEVRFGERHAETQAFELACEAGPRRLDARQVGLHPRQVAEGGVCGRLGEAAEVVRVLHRAEAGEQVGVAERQADAESGE